MQATCAKSATMSNGTRSIDALRDGVQHARHRQRVAVGRRGRAGLCADDVARARLVLDDDGLLELCRHLLRQRTDRAVVGAAGRRER